MADDNKDVKPYTPPSGSDTNVDSKEKGVETPSPASDTSRNLSEAATKAHEQAAGKKGAEYPELKADVPQLDPGPIAQLPSESPGIFTAPPGFTRPGGTNIGGLLNQAREATQQEPVFKAPPRMFPPEQPMGMPAQMPQMQPREASAWNQGDRNLAPQQEIHSGNWNDPSFLNPVPSLAEAKRLFRAGNHQAAFAILADGMGRLDILNNDPNNVAIINRDIKELDNKVKEITRKMGTANSAEQKKLEAEADPLIKRIELGQAILKSRWEGPVGMAIALLRLNQGGEPPKMAFDLVRKAAGTEPAIRQDPEIALVRDNMARLYGQGNLEPPGAQRVVQLFNQALDEGARTAAGLPVNPEPVPQPGTPGKAPEQRPTSDGTPPAQPTYGDKAREEMRKKRLESNDPTIHEQEYEALRKTKPPHHEEVVKEHKKSVELARAATNKKGESVNSILADITKTKTSIAAGRDQVSKLQKDIDNLKRESKVLASDLAVINAKRAADESKANSKNWLEVAGAVYSNTWNSLFNADQIKKEQKDFDDKFARMSEITKKVALLEAQKKGLVGDPNGKTAKDKQGQIGALEADLKTKQEKLAEVGKPIADKHVSYAKLLLADAREQGLAANQATTDEDRASKVMQSLKDLQNAAKEINRAEALVPKLADDEEIKGLKKDYHLITSPIGENVTGIVDEKQRQAMVDAYLDTVNAYNQTHQASADGTPTPQQALAKASLANLTTEFPQLERDTKLVAAFNLIKKGSIITEDALNAEATSVAKDLFIEDSTEKGKKALENFQKFYGNKQFKDAELEYESALQNMKPYMDAQRQKLKDIQDQIDHCVALEQLPELRAKKEAMEKTIAADQNDVLASIKSLYLMPTEGYITDEKGVKHPLQGPGQKPERAIRALDEVKALYPELAQNPNFQKIQADAEKLTKDLQDLKIRAAEDAEKAKDAGIDLTTGVVSWGAAAAAGTAIAAGVGFVAGAPVTVPIALAVGGGMLITGLATGALTKTVLANTLDAKDKDLGHNITSGALTGAFSATPGAGFKIGGAALAYGVAAKGGTVVWEGIKYANVADRIAKYVPLSKQAFQATAEGARLKAATTDVEAWKVGCKILEERVQAGLMTQNELQAATQAMAKSNSWLGTVKALSKAGVPIREQVSKLTAAGTRLDAAKNESGWKIIDIGYKAMNEGIKKNAWYRVDGHIKNAYTLASYAAPYAAQKGAVAVTSIGLGAGMYNAGKYIPKGIVGEEKAGKPGEHWTLGESVAVAGENTFNDTLTGSVSLGAFKGAANLVNKPLSVLRTAELTATLGVTGGMITNTIAQIGKFKPVQAIGQKIGSWGPVVDSKAFYGKVVYGGGQGDHVANYFHFFNDGAAPIVGINGADYYERSQISEIDKIRLDNINLPLQNLPVEDEQPTTGSSPEATTKPAAETGETKPTPTSTADDSSDAATEATKEGPSQPAQASAPAPAPAPGDDEPKMRNY